MTYSCEELRATSLFSEKPIMSGSSCCTIIASVFIMSMLPPISSWACDIHSNSIDLSKYKNTFTEDFDSLSVGAWSIIPGHNRWMAHTPWAGDFGDAKFVDPKPGFPFTVSNGVLRIEAKKNPAGQWESGLLSLVDPHGVGFAQKYGYFEARMKMPPGKGVWPAFWLIGIEEAESRSEIDVVEYYGDHPDTYATVWHIWMKDQSKKGLGEEHFNPVRPGELSESFHQFGVDISEDFTCFYLDRHEVWRFKTPVQYKQPFYPLVNLALGAGYPLTETPNPSYLWVDYIKIYQRN